jgi:universal stress protein A
MTKLERILVPVDFSPGSHIALEYAAFLAAKVGASIDVLHVMEPHPYPAAEAVVQLGGGAVKQTLAEFARSEAGKAMEKLLADAEGHPGIGSVKGRLESGRPSEVIAQTAHDAGYDLIVMGTHGRTGLSRLFLGSVAEQVQRLARCPVLTVRLREHDGAAAESG